MMDKLAMGGYGAYIWSCYLVVMIVLASFGLSFYIKHRHIVKEIKKYCQRVSNRDSNS